MVGLFCGYVFSFKHWCCNKFATHTHFMAYTPANKLQRALMVQDVYRKYSQEGVTDVYIYQHFIKSQFLIGMRTFYNYLALPASRDLQKLAAA